MLAQKVTMSIMNTKIVRSMTLDGIFGLDLQQESSVTADIMQQQHFQKEIENFQKQIDKMDNLKDKDEATERMIAVMKDQ